MVADVSAVDGINFSVKYELTVGGGETSVMEIHENPCQDLDKKYTLDAVDVGCRNPALIDCTGGQPTCDCKPSSQNCKFNACSQTLFQIPQDMQKYITEFDGTKQGDPHPVVKSFINDESNLKAGSPLKNFCDRLHRNSGSFTAYCYDYNDTSSSPWLRSPYKLKVTYMDLDH